MREVCIWAKLQHLNVIPLLGVSVDGSGTPSLISEWMGNGTLTAYMKSHPDADVLQMVRIVYFFYSTEMAVAKIVRT